MLHLGDGLNNNDEPRQGKAVQIPRPPGWPLDGDGMPFLYYETFTIPSLTLLKIVTSEQKKLLFKLFKSFVFSLEGTIIIIM